MQSAILIASLLRRVKNMGVLKAMKELGSEHDVIPMLVPAFINSTCFDRNTGECFVCTGELVIYAEDCVCQINLQAVPYRRVHSATELHKHCYIFPFSNFHCSVSAAFAGIRGYERAAYTALSLWPE